jgi:hypothetical protein
MALIAKRPAAGATNIAKYCVMFAKNGLRPPQSPIVQVFGHIADATPIITNDSAPIRNVGIRSCVIVPNAKNDKIPTKNPRTATIAPEGVARFVRSAFTVSPIPNITPNSIATTIPIRNNQLPSVFNILSIPSPLFYFMGLKILTGYLRV